MFRALVLKGKIKQAVQMVTPGGRPRKEGVHGRGQQFLWPYLKEQYECSC